MKNYSLTYIASLLLLCVSLTGYSQKSTFVNINIEADSTLSAQGITKDSKDFENIALVIDGYVDDWKTGSVDIAEYQLSSEISGGLGDVIVHSQNYTTLTAKIDSLFKAEMKKDPAKMQQMIKEFTQFSRVHGSQLYILNDANYEAIKAKCANSKTQPDYTITLSACDSTTFVSRIYPRNVGASFYDMLIDGSTKPIVVVKRMIYYAQSASTMYGQDITLAFIDNKWQVVRYNAKSMSRDK
jgi:hypothetical protein